MQTHSEPATRNVNITIRSYPDERNFIDHAAKICGKTRSDFMLEAARNQAEQTLLDRRLFNIDTDTFQAFETALSQPVQENTALMQLLQTRSPWES